MTSRILLIGLFVVISPCVATAQSGASQRDCPGADALSDLRERYAWGAMYITPSRLVDVLTIAQRPTKVQRFAQEGTLDGLDVLSSWAKTLPQVSRKVSVLHLDLCRRKAGFIEPEPHSASLVDLNWSPREVERAAIWYDTFIRGTGAIGRLASLEVSGPLSDEDLVAIWSQLAAGIDDPYVAPSVLSAASNRFRGLLALHPEILRELADSQPDISADIEQFRVAYDTVLYESRLRDPGSGVELLPWLPQGQDGFSAWELEELQFDATLDARLRELVLQEE